MKNFWFPALWTAVMALGALRGEDPLVRVMCRLSLLGLALVGTWLVVNGPRGLRRLVLTLGLVSFVSLPAMLANAFFLGGSAVNGRVSEDRYYLVDHGEETETSRLRYWTVATLEMTVFVSMPCLFLVLGYDRWQRESTTSEPDRLSGPPP